MFIGLLIPISHMLSRHILVDRGIHHRRRLRLAKRHCILRAEVKEQVPEQVRAAGLRLLGAHIEVVLEEGTGVT